MTTRRKSSYPARLDLVKAQLSMKIEKWERQLADVLNVKAQHLSLRARLIYLAAFCLLIAAINLYLLFRSL